MEVRWTTEVVAKLRVMWTAGRSGSEIAKELGFTRNSILGKVHRLGLETRVHNSRGGRPKREGSERKPRAPYVLKPKKPAPIADARIHPGQRKHFLELGHYSCRWPVGDTQSGFWAGDLFFCGDVRVDGGPYCEAHCRRAYTSQRMNRAGNEIRRRTFLRQARAA